MIREELKEFLPHLASTNDPLRHIQKNIVPVMIVIFELEQVGTGVVKYLVLNGTLELTHWFFKDWIKNVGLLLASMRPLLTLRLMLKQVCLWEGVSDEQQRRVIKVGMQHEAFWLSEHAHHTPALNIM